MAETTAFELVTPMRVMVSCAARMVIAPGAEGVFGVLPRHAPFISTLRRGVVEVHTGVGAGGETGGKAGGKAGGGAIQRIMVDGGLADVAEERCAILAERAEALTSANKPHVQAQLKFAEEKGHASTADFLRAVLAQISAS